MKTQIYKTWSEFFNREDKTLNGVSPEFAEKNPKFEAMNENNEGCWNCYGCYNCYNCCNCSRCYDCSRCLDCSDCSGSPIKVSPVRFYESQEKAMADIQRCTAEELQFQKTK